METRYKFHIEFIENGKCQKHDFEGTTADYYWFIAQLPEDARINATTWEEIKESKEDQEKEEPNCTLAMQQAMFLTRM